MNPRKIFYVLAEVHSAVSFEWIAESQLAHELKFTFILLNFGDTFLERRLRDLGQEVIRIHYASRGDIFSALKALYRLFRQRRPDIVHTHLLAANLAGLIAAWLAKVPVRIYTRHHSIMNQVGAWHAKFYDWIPNILATKIVATCENVRALLLKEGVPDEKISIIRFGFPSDFSEHVSSERILQVRQKYGLLGCGPVIGVISRYVPYKGVPHIILGFAEILTEYPDACLLLANASKGGDAGRIKELLADFSPKSYREVAFEDDSQALYKCFDAFVHTPLDRFSEAFGQIYIESMLAQVPSVFTMSGVAPEVVRDGVNALVVPYADSRAIAAALKKILGNQEFSRRISEQARADAIREFSLSKMLQELGRAYS